ncbi:hypothetical protein ACHAXA_003631 [Cyclostephanos tholiformis]|uniref:Phospholipid:diacylglycerol acyltransferase n=1 Tax=Cyclostephanos tholiformis TaxID=382380 RepID=A0ABD3SQP1_9STRA
MLSRTEHIFPRDRRIGALAPSLLTTRFMTSHLSSGTIGRGRFVALAVLSTIILISCFAQLIYDDDPAEDNSNALDSVGSGNHRIDGTSIDETSSDSHGEMNWPRITLLGLEDSDILKLERSGIVGLGNDFYYETRDGDIVPPRLNYNQLHANDMIEDSIYDPFSPDPSCVEANSKDYGSGGDCWQPPGSTLEEEIIQVSDCGDVKSAGLETLSWGYGGADPDDNVQEEEAVSVDGSDGVIEGGNKNEQTQSKSPIDNEVSTKVDATANGLQCQETSRFVDKHWGSDINILKMRDQLLGRRGKYWDVIDQEIQEHVVANDTGSVTNNASLNNAHEKVKQNRGTSKVKRPPIFLLPGLASTRLVSWKHKSCPHNPLLSDIKMLDYVWLNMNLLIQMATIDARCWSECLTLGKYQSDYDGADKDVANSELGKKGDEKEVRGCKLRPDEGIDSISSLAPGSISSNFLVGGTNTVYAWLVQWLAENLNYDVRSIVALPYDWRLSPDKMESRDGFLTQTRRKIEAAVEFSGMPGIMVAHSMGNNVFRYFLEWLRVQMREEAYERYVQQTKLTQAAAGQGLIWRNRALYRFRHMVSTPDNAAEIEEDAVFDEMTRLLEGKNDSVKINEEETENYGKRKFPKLYELAKIEGDTEWINWLGKHVWTYVGLAAPLLGAPGPLRSVLSGENMGLPFTNEEARCKESGDPWTDFPALRLLLKGRVDFDTIFSTVEVQREYCKENEKPPCLNQTVTAFGPRDVMSGALLDRFKSIWREKDDPLGVKLDQLRDSWWDRIVPNILQSPPDRPHIKHVIMAYGVNVPTEVGYVYRKTEKLEATDYSAATKRIKAEDFDGVPFLAEVIWEEPRGKLVSVSQMAEPASFADTILRKKKDRRRPLKNASGESPTWLHLSGDGTIPYLSLMWAHTWLLHATRAMRSFGTTVSMLEGERISTPTKVLDSIKVSHRKKGGNEWVEGYGANPVDEDYEESRSNDGDTGTSHPHGTKYKPKMVRFEASGRSRSTGMEYTTTVIEAIGVEHKETTRNYDILAAVFTDVLKNLHDDYGLI